VLDVLENILTQNTAFGTCVLRHRRNHARSTHNGVFASGRRTDAGARATANIGDVFVPMEKFTSGGSMLNLQPSTYRWLWEWREDKINLMGATQSIMVRIRYFKVLTTLTLGTDPVQIRSATDALGYATAALAARSRRREHSR
jgi:hypothetical protein